ncbi:hypothetical protein HH310_22145 [Actinoplanes sp. TBRC 11911]|uniref:hypothetical protein n=1 Tax=Actinoplanes sp. TBRC 11911 TaxID=2729386 RepID=UPI00145D82C1|nr:hypothetical protein [Actinoplanes sp. TBRC 11911]NMO53871.1 hypothetical protein [Actinoplanes sp. TBRC 11911]
MNEIFATPQPIAATVSVAGARLRVIASDRTDTAVLAEPIESAEPIGSAEPIKVAFSRGHLTVKATRSGEKITIYVPAGSSLVAYASHSDVQAAGPLGDCELHSASSRVRLDRVDSLQANTAGGEIEVGHVAGRASVRGGGRIVILEI